MAGMAVEHGAYAAQFQNQVNQLESSESSVEGTFQEQKVMNDTENARRREFFERRCESRFGRYRGCLGHTCCPLFLSPLTDLEPTWVELPVPVPFDAATVRRHAVLAAGACWV